LAEQGIEMIAPNRANRSATQAGRPLRRDKRRWTVERTIARLQNYRRRCIRREKSPLAFQGFLHLACSLLLMKEVLGWLLVRELPPHRSHSNKLQVMHSIPEGEETNPRWFSRFQDVIDAYAA
jgi:hypothetical protein